MERRLDDAARRRGAHYTPADLADEVAARALPTVPRGARVVDPACGAGALLLAAGRRLVAAGEDRAAVARAQLWGADIDPVAVAVAEAAIALWSGGTAPAAGHLVVGDPLRHGAGVWPDAPTEGFAAVVGNPPFQGQLARATARAVAETEALRARFDAALGPYVDTAALFLLVGVDLAAPGARVAMVQPQSTAAARDAGAVREALAGRAALVDLWAPPGRVFAARVHVCVPVLEVGRLDPDPRWSARLAAASGVPPVALPDVGTVADRASVVASFREHHYALAPHVTEAPADGRAPHPLLTSGLIDLGGHRWGRAPVRFDKRRWERPVVDVAAAAAAHRRLRTWLPQVLRPKLVVATQTRVLEAAPDPLGDLVPTTPTVSVLPHDPAALDALLVAVCSPPATAWLAARMAGSGLTSDALRVPAALVGALPLPADDRHLGAAVAALRAGDLRAFGEAATAGYRLPDREAERVLGWWLPRAEGTGVGNRAARTMGER